MNAPKQQRQHQLLFVFVLSFVLSTSSAFTALPRNSFAVTSRPARLGASTTTIEAPTKERTDRSTARPGETTYDDDNIGVDYPDLEYLQDSSESRENEDPFHILLLGSTFEKPKITVPYVSGSLEYVLSMPSGEARELSQFAHDEGMSCLGTWPREECLGLGRALQVRDLVCRVVPYCEGGQRGWQAKDADAGNGEYSDAGAGAGGDFLQ